MNNRLFLILTTILLLGAQLVFPQYGAKEIQVLINGHQLIQLPFESSSGEKAISVFKYNTEGKLIQSEWTLLDHSRSSVNSYKYDTKGNIVEKNRVFSDGITSTKSFEYDNNNHLIIENFKRSDGVVNLVRYKFNIQGNVEIAEWQGLHGWFNGTINFFYDEGGLLTNGKFIQEGKEVGSINYTYDESLNLVEEYWEFPGSYSVKFNFKYHSTINKQRNTQIDYSNAYCGENPPDTVARLFSPNFVSTNLYTRDLAITPDGKEIYFCVSTVKHNLIFVTKQNKLGIWSNPVPAPFIDDTRYMYYEPCISSDGKRMLFLSNKPFKGQESEDIWCVDRIGDTWGKPYNLGEPINTSGAEFYPSLTKSGTLYFTRSPKGDTKQYTYRAKLGKDGKYLGPEKLPANVNIGKARFNAYISPNEDFIIVPASGMEDSFGGIDYYILFRNNLDEWSKPINMGPQVNSSSNGEFSASLSPDGKYLFFMSDRNNLTNLPVDEISIQKLQQIRRQTLNGTSNIYWISSEIIEKLRPKNF